MNAFDLGQNIHNHKLPFRLYPALWNKFNSANFNYSDNEIIQLKYLNDDGTDFNAEVDDIPNDKGGIYFYYIKFDKINEMANYLVYIGRAQFTTNQNLKKRCKEYFNGYKNDPDLKKMRPKIYRMLHTWGKNLYLKFIIINNNDKIKELEADLINTILPPFNNQILDKDIRDAVKAFDN